MDYVPITLETAANLSPLSESENGPALQRGSRQTTDPPGVWRATQDLMGLTDGKNRTTLKALRVAPIIGLEVHRCWLAKSFSWMMTKLYA